MPCYASKCAQQRARNSKAVSNELSVRFGSEAAIHPRSANVRYAPKADIRATQPATLSVSLDAPGRWRSQGGHLRGTGHAGCTSRPYFFREWPASRLTRLVSCWWATHHSKIGPGPNKRSMCFALFALALRLAGQNGDSKAERAKRGAQRIRHQSGNVERVVAKDNFARFIGQHEVETIGNPC
jgi:hypothetical protein